MCTYETNSLVKTALVDGLLWVVMGTQTELEDAAVTNGNVDCHRDRLQQVVIADHMLPLRAQPSTHQLVGGVILVELSGSVMAETLG